MDQPENISRNENFLTGVIEGFYGQPWSAEDRHELFSLMPGWGFNSYLYGPKDDLYHRALWRKVYPQTHAERLRSVIQECHLRNIRFIYALSPGLSIRYTSTEDSNSLKARLEQLTALGCESFALLFDDIPDHMATGDIARFGTLARAQAHVANRSFEWLSKLCPSRRFLFCPTAYCGRMAERHLGGEGYLQELGSQLASGIDILWTGPEIISREITAAHMRDVGEWLRRKPVLWDNLHANDYDGRRVFLGPYSGRDAELLNLCNGVLSNPNCEFPLNYVPLRTLSEWIRASDTYEPRREFLAATREWLAKFETVSAPLDFDELVLLSDCFYLPFEDGPEASRLFQAVASLLARDPGMWQPQELVEFRRASLKLREACTKVTEVVHRPLFYSLCRRTWELREELDLLERCITTMAERPHSAQCRSDFHLPETYRGGFVARLQQLLVQHPDGNFTLPDIRMHLLTYRDHI